MNQRVGHWLLPAILAGGLAACALTKPPPDVDPKSISHRVQKGKFSTR